MNLTIKISADMDAQLKSLAKRRRRTKAALAKDALSAYLAETSRQEAKRPSNGRNNGGKKRPTLYELAHDLIGKYEGPADLSTNPKYMEGFGE